jgi:3-isopropylmalate/(R)-2-methylmalate dehydratase small subunit
VFGNNLDVDWEICDLHWLQEQSAKGIIPTEEDLAKRCLVRLDPEFPKKIRKGDFLVAGEAVGYSGACLDGYSDDPHMHAFATLALKGAGISAVLCESAAVNFQRNSLDMGFPVVECRGIRGKVRQGDELEVDLETGSIRNLTTGMALEFAPFPHFILEMLAAGGLYRYIESQM